MSKSIPLVQSEIYWNQVKVDTTKVVVLSLAEYMEGRRKSIDRYVEGEHKWYGDLSTSTHPVSMYEGNIPWYLNDTLPDTKRVN